MSIDSGSDSVSTGDTSLTNPTNFGTVFTAGPSGGSVGRFDAVAAGTTTNGMIRLFRLLADGTTKKFLMDLPTTGTIPGGTVQAAAVNKVFSPPLPLKASEKLLFTTYNTETWNGWTSGALQN